ncbi:MAG: 1-deoxy-D-xylulose-5-phosphate synthase [Cyclobacteriaceae bacterium]|nr:1-deoxy-D-xylulose-5-phosphate synthase [Cyclobacteriaceae bacterium]
MKIKPGDLLENITSPEELRKLDRSTLTQLSKELRDYIIDSVSVYGGHFASSLGVVELTVALHYVFNTPNDQLIWDVGHQAYGHKILTGRRDKFHTNRIYKGVSGFPKRDESKYDAFGVGHSSTSISAALGMAVASAIKGEKDRQHIAVIGDGALTGGLAFEAMNHAGVANSNVLIILNDNNMSIDPNVGALKDYLTDITTSQTYNKIKDEAWKILGKLNKLGPNAQELASKFENSIKSFLLQQSNLFESLNLRYFGPIDGHDVDHLVSVLSDMKNIKGPKILHCITTKGKGFKPAEQEQTKWHATGSFDKVTGAIHKKTVEKPQPAKYQDVFGHTLVELAKANDKIVGITPAMPSGCSLNIMMEAMPDRAFDVGIAEQHAVTFSAGLATQGLVPFCNIYSTFMQRAYDQVIHDVAIQNLPVNFCLDRAGFAGADGPTHHGAYDLAFMRSVPNMIIAAPINEEELRNLMFTAQKPRKGKAFTIRYPRGQGVMINWKTPMRTIEIGTGEQLVDGDDIAILTIGHVGNYALNSVDELASKGISAAVYNMRFVKPLDTELLHKIMGKFNNVITVEDGTIVGGFGSAIIEFNSENNYLTQVKRLGIPDEIIEHGTQEQLQHQCGFDTAGIVATALDMANKRKPSLIK